MVTKFVQILCDIDCKWDQVSPRYRVFVNDELFTERTWIWRDQYLEEMLQVEAKPGIYKIRVELVEPELGILSVNNIRIAKGHAQIVNNTVEIFE